MTKRWLPEDLEPPLAAVREAVTAAIKEDLLPIGDLSAGLLPASAYGRAAFVARAAGVSRSWLYAQDDLREQIGRLRTRQQKAPSSPLVSDRQRATPASLLRRLEAATVRIRVLESENRQLRDALERAIGQQRAAAIRSPATTRPESTVQKDPGRPLGKPREGP